MTGIDVLMYFEPGKDVTYKYFPDACERLIDAHGKFGDWMSSTFAETEVSDADQKLKNFRRYKFCCCFFL